jgi:hypothetical protein
MGWGTNPTNFNEVLAYQNQRQKGQNLSSGQQGGAIGIGQPSFDYFDQNGQRFSSGQQGGDIGIGGGNNPFMGSVDQWQQANAGPGYNVQNYGGNATGMGVNTPQAQMDERAALQKLMQGGNASQQARAAQLMQGMPAQGPQMSRPMRPPQQGGLLGGGMGGYGQQNPLMQMLMGRMGGGMGGYGGMQQRPPMYGGGQQMGGMGGQQNQLLQMLMQRMGGGGMGMGSFGGFGGGYGGQLPQRQQPPSWINLPPGMTAY